MVRTAKHTVKHLIELALGLCGLAVVVCFGLIWQLSRGDIPLGAFSPLIQSAINSGTEDFSVEVDDMALRWSDVERSIDVRFTGVDFIDLEGNLVGSVSQVEIDLDISSLLKGQLSPSRVEIFGPSAAVTRNGDGSFELGLSDTFVWPAETVEEKTPETVVVDADTSADGVSEGEGQSAASVPEMAKQTVTSDGREQILAMLIHQFESEEGLGGKLETFTIRDAKLDFFDAQSGTLWSSADAVVSLDRKTDGMAWWMAGTFRVGPEEVEVNLIGSLSQETGGLWSEVNFSNVRPSSFAAKSSFFTEWAGLDFPVAGRASFELGGNGKVKTADLELAAGEGTLQLDALGEKPLAVSYGALSAGYDGTKHVFNIRRLHYVGKDNRATFSGTTHAIFNTKEQLQLSSARFDLQGEDISVFIPETMTAPASIDHVELQGMADLDYMWLSLEKALIQADPMEIALEGDIVAAEASPMVILNGTVNHVPIERLDTYWPTSLAKGAREWVMERIKGGEITNGKLTIDAAAGALAHKPIPQGALAFAFDAVGGSVKYKRGMPWMEDASASIVLTGQSLSLELKEGTIREDLEQPVRVAAGSTVEIPSLYIKGSDIFIDADLEGRAEDILALVDHEPLNYLAKFGLDRSIIHGKGRTNFWFSIPMMKVVPPDAIKFKAKGRIEDLYLTKLPNDLRIDQGTLDLDINLDGLHGEGNMLVEGMPVQLVWDENFKAKNDVSSTFKFSAVVDDTARDEFGVDMLGYVNGPIPVEVIAKGKGIDLKSLVVTANLDNAEIEVSEFGFSKETGEKVTAVLKGSRDDAGHLILDRLDLEGDTMAVAGTLALAPDGMLETADFDRIYVDDVVDVAFKARRNDNGELLLDIHGAYLNAGPVLENMMKNLAKGDKKDETKAEATPEEEAPWLGWILRGHVDKLYMRGGVAIADTQLDITNNGEKFEMISLTGEMENDNDVFVALTFGKENKRHLLVTADDGGKVIYGLTGVNQVEGGKLSLRMELDDAPETVDTAEGPLTLAEYLNDYANAQEGANDDQAVRAVLEEGHHRYRAIKTQSSMNGYLKMEDFKLVDAPIMAKLLTVGSLKGLSDTLNGDGIHFDTLELPFWVDKNGVIGISDATAKGSALGLTLYGTFDQDKDETDLQGTIVPSYTLNSALGNLPIFGPILVSREGEGVFAFTYGISGPTTGPTVYVNPLAGLAPGVLRRVFQPRDQLEARRVNIEELENTLMPVDPADGAPEGLQDLPEEMVDGPDG